MMKITTLLKCIVPFLVLSFYSCDSATSLFVVGSVNVINCNNEHLLEPPVDHEVQFQVLVRNSALESMEGVALSVVFTKHTCNGKTFHIYNEEISTDENGLVTGFIPISFTWDNDAVEWTVGVSTLDLNYASHVERFGPGTDFLHTIITIAELDN